MKRMMMGMALTAALSVMAMAQPTSQPARATRPGPMMQRMNDLLDELNLTDEQQQKIDDILVQARQSMQKLRQELQDSDLLPPERRQRMQEAMKTIHDEIGAMLDEAQREIFENRIEQWRQQRQAPGRGPTSRPSDDARGTMQPGGPGGGMGNGPETALARLENALQQIEIGDEQKEQTRAILADANQKLDELRQQADPPRGQYRALMQETRKKINQVLTPEQRDELRRLVPGPRGNHPDKSGGVHDTLGRP